MTGEGDTSLGFDLDELFREIEAKEKLRKLRRNRPWTRDIIRVLWPSRSGLQMNILEREVWKLRNESLPMPKEFRKTIQSTLNHHTSQSQVFHSKGRKQDDDLFYSPKGKGSGTWAVHHKRAAAWLKSKELSQPK